MTTTEQPVSPVRIALAGAGAFGLKHLDALRQVPGAVVTTLISPAADDPATVAGTYGIEHVDDDLASALTRPDVDAVILATPTPMHASQAAECLRAGKHVEVEIPMADNIADARMLVELQASTGLVAMVGHTRRFNPSHQWLHQRIQNGELSMQHLDVQTFFFRRTNINALGKPRSWTDHLLWHHSAHTIDLFTYQTGGRIVAANVLEGPMHPELGIAMDMSIQLKASTGAICTLSLSFNNDGPLGTFFRYICDNGTYIARYDDLVDGKEQAIDVSQVDVSMNGIELQDREFVAAIREGRVPNASFSSVFPCYEVMHQLDEQLSAARLRL
jgi:2-hydroxy-4-carboxymuconate semialdehyde hemiacetal dehydrogenase